MKEEKLISIQPYFVLDTDSFCQRVLLKNGISHFFSFYNSSKDDITVKLLVDGCSNIIFEYAKSDDGNTTVRTHFIGSTLEVRTFCVRKGCEYFGVRLQPTVTHFIKEIDAKNSVGKIIILDEFDSMKDFCLRMKNESTFDGRIKTFLECYALSCAGGGENNTTELFRQIAEIIINRRGMVKVSELEKLSGYTARYINQIFDRELGFSAKQLCTSVKFQFLLNDLNHKNLDSLTGLSSEYMFYDQAHFIHEFKTLTGKTPSEYASEVSKKNYEGSVSDV